MFPITDSSQRTVSERSNNWAPRVGLAYRPVARKKPSCAVGYENFFSMPRWEHPLWTLCAIRRSKRGSSPISPIPFSPLSLWGPGTEGLHRQLELFRLRAGEGGKTGRASRVVCSNGTQRAAELVRNWAATVAYVGSTGPAPFIFGIANIPFGDSEPQPAPAFQS